MRLLIIVAIVVVLASCDGPSPIEHASSDFATVVEGQEHVLTYEGTHDVMRDQDPAIFRRWAGGKPLCPRYHRA